MCSVVPDCLSKPSTHKEPQYRSIAMRWTKDVLLQVKDVEEGLATLELELEPER